MSGIETHTTATGEKLAAFVSANGHHAYHRLGEVVEGSMNAQQALQKAHLSGWHVRKAPLVVPASYMDAEGVTTMPAPVEVPGHYAMVRDNPFTGVVEPLGVVGGVFKPIQNEEHADFLDAVVKESGAHYETAGSLKGGREVFVTMRLPESVQVGGVDPVNLYLAGHNFHDGRGAFRVSVTPVRVECSNTLTLAEATAKHAFSIRHTGNAAQAFVEARRALELTFKYAEAFQEEAERLINTAMTEARFAEVVREFQGKAESEREQRKFDAEFHQLVNLFVESPTATEIRGTAWAGYQAFTEYVDFYAPVRNTSGSKEYDRARRAVSADGVAYKQRALELVGA